MKRRFVDAPDRVRCRADIRLKDGSNAQCGRRELSKDTHLCWQHQASGPLSAKRSADNGGTKAAT